MTQLSLLPIVLRDEFEVDREKIRSKDLLWTGIDHTDQLYALKTVEDNPDLPLTEWVCYHLCHHCGIPAPDFAVLVRKDGSKAFGSRWEKDVDQFVRDETTLQQLVAWLSQCVDDISAIAALDQFLPNDDRHMANYLFRRQPRRRALAFDWSRTKLFEPWPLEANSATTRNVTWFKQNGLYNNKAAKTTLEKLADLSHIEFEKIVFGMANEWGSQASKEGLVKWWKEHRHARIRSL